MVTGGWLEHEIRSLPQVLACSVTDDDVVVLIQPAADPAAVERAVSDVLRRVGMWRPVRVFGGVRPAFAEPVRIRPAARSAVVGAVSGAAILAAGVWLAGAATGVRGSSSRQVVAAPPPLPPPIVRDVVQVPDVLPERFAPPAPEIPPAPSEPAPVLPEPRGASPPILRPVRRPPLVVPLPPAGPPPLPPVPPVELDDDSDDTDDFEDADDTDDSDDSDDELLQVDDDDDSDDDDDGSEHEDEQGDDSDD